MSNIIGFSKAVFGKERISMSNQGNLARLSRVRFYILPEGSLHIGKYIVQ